MRKNALAEWVFNFIVLIFATGSIAQAFVIPSGSMESTLLTGDHVLVDKLVFAPSDPISRYLLPYEPVRRGDIIVFRSPADLKLTLVKRVVGLPGDHIRLVAGRVWRNGLELQEPYVQHILPPNEYRDNFPNAPPRPGELSPGAGAMLDCCVSTGELIVPAASYFAMGDNRDNSLDSRYWGFVPAANIVGKPVLVWWSYEASETELTDMVNFRHLVDMSTHFFSKTRWNRTMRLVRGAD